METGLIENSTKSWAQIGFEVELTADGSPSLRLLQGSNPLTGKGESMHHSGGAAAETELIYGQVITRCFGQESQPHFLSVGLGLGYIELTVARESLRLQREFTLESFEIVPELKSYFLSWLQEEALPEEIAVIYNQVLGFILKGFAIEARAVKSLLRNHLKSGSWSLRGALDQDMAFGRKAHAILFDAFSAKTTPELWSEEFLQDFLNLAAAEKCSLSTYSCRGTLKRALVASGFAVTVREGFMSKRNSTLGER